MGVTVTPKVELKLLVKNNSFLEVILTPKINSNFGVIIAPTRESL